MVTWTKRELLVVKINTSQLLKFLMNKKRSQIIIHSATLHTFLSFPHFSYPIAIAKSPMLSPDTTSTEPQGLHTHALILALPFSSTPTH